MSPALPGTLQTLFAYRLKLVAKELTTSMVILSYSLGTAWAKIPLASHTVALPKGHIWQRPTRAHPDPTGKSYCCTAKRTYMAATNPGTSRPRQRHDR